MKIFAICQSGLGTSFMVQMNIESALQDAGVDMENFTVEHTDSGSVSGDMADYFFAEKTLVPALTNLPEEKIVALNSIIDAEEITENELEKDSEETKDLIKKFYAGEISIPEQTEQEELEEKIEVFQAHLNREVSSNLRNIIKGLEWDEIVKADMQINSNKKEDYCTEKYIINAIYNNKKRTKLKLVK